MSLSLEKYQDMHRIFKYRQRKIGSLEVEQYISITDDQGMQCIHWAMLFQDDDVIKFLILAGASINAQTKNGLTPVHLSLLVESNNLTEFKKFHVDKFFSYLLGSPFTRKYRDNPYLGYDVTCLILIKSRQQPDLSLREKFGFNSVTVTNLFKAYSRSRVLINSINVTPALVMDFLLTSVNFQSFSWKKNFTNSVYKVLSIQVKQGILPRYASFISRTEPHNVSEVSSIIESKNALMYVWDVTIGFPNPILTLIVLLDSEEFLLTREDLKFTAIIGSLAPLINKRDFEWVSIRKHLLLTKYIRWNFEIYVNRIGDMCEELSRLLNYVQYLLVFVDIKLHTIKYGIMKEVLDSLLYWSVILLISIWHLSEDYAQIKGVIEFLQDLSLKHKLSLYHFFLSNYKKVVIDDTDPINFLLENGFNCNVRTEESSGLSVLNFAYNKQDTGACLLLLRHGAYPLSVDRFNMSFVDEVVKCPTALPLRNVKMNKIEHSNALIRGISKDPQLKEIWIKFSRLPYTLLTLTAQSIAKHKIPYGRLTSKMVAFIELHDPKKFECHNSPVS